MPMSQSPHLYFLVTLLSVLSFQGTSTFHHNYKGLKSLNFSLYQHDILNKTSYLIVNGVAGAGFTNTTSSFGTAFAYQDPLTIDSNFSSEVVGIAEGISITSSFDGLTNIAIFKITLNMKHHKGSISIVGSGHNIRTSDLPVVGGTCDFMFVQGYVTYSLVDIKDFNVVNKVEFHLYWPPYATQASS